MAGCLNTDWFVVYVETPGESPNRIDAETQRHLLDNIDRAQQLGAQVVRLQAKDPVSALLDFARAHGVGHIIRERSQQPWWRQLTGRSAILRLVKEAGGFDVHIASPATDRTWSLLLTAGQKITRVSNAMMVRRKPRYRSVIADSFRVKKITDREVYSKSPGNG